MNPSSHSVARGESQTDTAKLVSLLALATGAAALPQTGHADIIYTDISSSPVVVGYAGSASHEFNLAGLPSGLQVGFKRFTNYAPFPFSSDYRYYVLGGKLGGVGVAKMRANASFAAPLDYGATWSAGANGSLANVAVGWASDINKSPASGYDHKYLAWSFEDTGNPRYGWAEISLSIALVNPGAGPNVVIWRYAYDNTGAKPTMGQLPVPEPTSGALLVAGALLLGSRGVRQWRQNRQPAKQA